MTDPKREDTDGKPVPFERWGKDHWSTFAYVETRIVDHGGYLDPRHLRGCNGDASMYPTRLRGKFGESIHLFGHTDLDCIADAVAAGLLEGGRATQRDHDYSIKRLTWHYQLTPKGHVVAGRLRAHKADGGQYHGFTPFAIEALHAEGIAV